jgi:signal transduction histidine kinase
VVAELEAAHPGHEVAVTVEGDTHATLDADRMAEVVSNLASNALAYSPANDVVHVDVAARDGELTLSVHNGGAPISPEKLKTLFAPFKRGIHAGVGPPSMRGLGLGLYIVGEITRAHGGSVDVTSTVEEGTTFTVRLPRGATGASVAYDARA